MKAVKEEQFKTGKYMAKALKASWTVQAPVDLSSTFDAEKEIPAWKSLENVINKWIVMTNFEKDQENYKNLADSLKN